MATEKQQQLIELLSEHTGWLGALELAEKLEVSDRTIRNYVNDINRRFGPVKLIESSVHGYRMQLEVYENLRSNNAIEGLVSGEQIRTSRAHQIVNRLAQHPLGLETAALARSMHVSLATLESDLRRARDILKSVGLSIVRQDGSLWIEGNEEGIRKVLSGLIYESLQSQFLNLDDIAARFELAEIAELKRELVGRLDYSGYIINGYGIDSVMLHFAIAVDRVRRGQTLPASDEIFDEDILQVADLLKGLAERHFEIDLGLSERVYLAKQLLSLVISSSSSSKEHAHMAAESDREFVQSVISAVKQEFLVDLQNEGFIERFALHLGHLVRRAKFDSLSRNPLTKSIKSSYPMFFDIAVFVGSLINKNYGVSVDEDEISYIALHVGGYLQSQVVAAELVKATIICPSYYDLHLVMRQSIEKLLGDEIEVENVITSTNFNADEITTDLVISTIPVAFDKFRVVNVRPLLAELDVWSIREAIGEIKNSRRQNKIRERLLSYFSSELFFRNVNNLTAEEMILKLGGALKKLGFIDDEYIEGAIERERLSSTVFVDGLAMPHSMSMTANVPTIAIVVNDTPMLWGDQKVNIVAFVAFGASGRGEFQTVFEQFIDLFSDDKARNTVERESRDFESFIDAVVRVIDT